MKTPILFLHGFPFNGSSWNPQVEYFKNKYEVHAPDLRGHRHGMQAPGPWMIAHFVEDLKKYLDEKKLSKVILCGLSMGGYIALHFVSLYPERVAALILSDTRADSDSNEAKDKRFATIQKLQTEGLKNFAADFSKNVLSEVTLKEKPHIQKNLEKMILENKVESVALTLGALASRKDSTPFLSKIICSTLVLVGEEDKITPIDVNEKLTQGIPNSKLVKIKNAGHLSNLEQSEKFNEALDNFLAGIK